jgi:hypothetical protein
MGRQCAARWNTVHGGLRVADPSHPIQLVNQSNTSNSYRNVTNVELCKNIGKFNDNYLHKTK